MTGTATVDPTITGTLLAAEWGVGRVRSMRRNAPDSTFVAVVIRTTVAGVDVDVIGVVDTRAPEFAELFAAPGAPDDIRVAPVVVFFKDVDVAFRVEVRRSPFADKEVRDEDLVASQQQRWVVSLRPASERDDPGFNTVNYVESRPARNARNFTTWLRISFALLCDLGSIG